MEKNRLNLVYVCVCTSMLYSGAIHSAQMGVGTITFKGSIIEAPCSISAATADQTISLGMVSTKSLAGGKTSQPSYFSIDLSDCTPGTLKSALVTFTGQQTSDKVNNGRLAITGTAKGASVGLRSGENDIKLGVPLSNPLTEGNNKFNFTAYLQGDSVSGADNKVTAKDIVPGDFQAVANFKLNYE